MHIFIDEAGTFIPPAHLGQATYSLVLALIVPTSQHDELCYEFLRVRDSWPHNAVEIKGSKLDEGQCDAVANLLARHDALLEVQIIDMGLHDVSCIADFKERQAQAVTANLTPRHQPTMIQELHKTADAFRELSNQLFVQAFLMMQLIMEAVEVGTLYHVQRNPKELANFTWIIDQKDNTLTAMERLWSKVILPAGVAQLAKKRPGRADWCDYSYYEKYEIDAANPECASHLAWLKEAYALDKTESGVHIVDWKKLIAEDRAFADSKNSLGL